MAHPIMFDEDDPVLARLRTICAALPESVEHVSHGRPVFRAGEKGRIFAGYGAGRRTGSGKGEHVRVDTALTLRIEDAELPAVDADDRFFVPMYAGTSPWRALDLADPRTEWDEVAELVDASYRLLAPARLVAVLDARGVDGG